MPRAKGIRLTQSEEDEIISLYQQGVSTTAIQQLCECGAGTIYNVLHRNNIARRKSTAEYGKCKVRNYFASIDTESKAYFLGMLLADGSVSDSTKITLTLQKSDESIVKTLAKELGMSSDEVKAQPPYQKAGWQSRLRFCSKQMRIDLARYGIVPNKTHETYLPSVPKHLQRHLIRGIFDGDGHVSKYIAYICGTKKLCTEIKNLLSAYSIETYLYQQKNTGVWYVKGSKKLNRTLFLRYIYEDASVFIERKAQIALDTHLTAPLFQKEQRKLRELLGHPEEGNQQPRLESNLSEGSTTSSYVPSGNMKDHERGAPYTIGKRVRYTGNKPGYHGLEGTITYFLDDIYLRMDIERVQVDNITCLVSEVER